MPRWKQDNENGVLSVKASNPATNVSLRSFSTSCTGGGGQGDYKKYCPRSTVPGRAKDDLLLRRLLETTKLVSIFLAEGPKFL